MEFDGAVVREQGVTFGVMIVKKSVIIDPALRVKVLKSAASVFGGIPVVLMAQDSRGIPTYFGRSDIARFMSGVPLGAVRWNRYTAT